MTELQLTLSPEQSADNQFIKKQIAKNLDIETNDISEFRIIRKSIDARGRIPLVIMQLRVFINENTDKHIYQEPFNYRNVSNKKEVIIIGSGPAGLFAALRLIELGFCPIIVERGKNVKERKVDVTKSRTYVSAKAVPVLSQTVNYIRVRTNVETQTES